MIDPLVKKLADELQEVTDRYKKLHVMVIVGEESKEDFIIFSNTCAACMLDLVHQFEEQAQPEHQGHESLVEEKEIIH